MAVYSNVGKYWKEEYEKGRYTVFRTVSYSIVPSLFAVLCVIMIYNFVSIYSQKFNRFLISNDGVAPWSTVVSLSGEFRFTASVAQLRNLSLSIDVISSFGSQRTQMDFIIVNICRRNSDFANQYFPDSREINGERTISVNKIAAVGDRYQLHVENLKIRSKSPIKFDSDWLCGELHLSSEENGRRINALIPFHSRTYLNGSQNFFYPPR